MHRLDTRASSRARAIAAFTAVCAVVVPAAAPAQSEGGLYIAGIGFSFQQAAEQGIAQNPGGRRFFLLSVPPETTALAVTAARPLAALRERVAASNGVLFVCQRDLDSGKVNASKLVPGVVTVRGWPSVGSAELAQGGRYFANENPANLPASNEALRRLRSICAY